MSTIEIEWRHIGDGRPYRDADLYQGPKRLGRSRPLTNRRARRSAARAVCPVRSTVLLDFSYGADQIRASDLAPYAGGAGYLSPNPAKNISRGLCEAVIDQGGGILLVWQAGARGPMGGGDQGMYDAIEANRQADRLGAPDTLPIRYAVDFAPTQSELLVVASYFRALVRYSKRPVKAYGADYVLNHLASAAGVQGDWQPVAWSGGRISQWAGARQMAGAPCWGYPRGIPVDENHLLAGRTFELWRLRPLEPARPYGHLAAPVVGAMWLPSQSPPPP